MDDFKRLVLCADDFGLSPGVSMGILQLAQQQRLSAVSCLVNAQYFSLYAKDLVALQERVQLGLHLNFTEGYFLSQKKPCFSLAELALKAHSRLLSAAFIKQELRAQLQQFIEITGRWPDFIDGHQHVHQFPVLRSILIAFYDECLREYNVSIRSTWPMVMTNQWSLKAKVLACSGGKTLHQLLMRHVIPHNPAFAGLYDFSSSVDYRSLFVQWLKKAPYGTLIMCHPGQNIKEETAIATIRFKEFSYLSSDAFLQDCMQHAVIL